MGRGAGRAAVLWNNAFVLFLRSNHRYIVIAVATAAVNDVVVGTAVIAKHPRFVMPQEHFLRIVEARHEHRLPD